jgi:type II secretion system protein N
MKVFDKEMHISDKHKKIAYCLYLTTAAVLFLVWLFPEDAARQFVARGVERINPHIRIDIADVYPVFPPGITFRGVAWSHKGDPVADSAYLRVTPGLFSLFGDSPRFYFKAGMSGGIIKGDGRVMKGAGAQADLKISGLKLEGIHFLSGISRHRITGLLDGDIKIKADGADVQTDSDIVCSGVAVALAAPVLGIQTLQFDTLEADLSATLRRIEIKTCTVKGQEVDGTFTGEILISEPYQKSILHLNGFLKPQAAFIKKVGKTLPIDILLKKQQGEKGFPVKLTGTFQEPEFALQ